MVSLVTTNMCLAQRMMLMMLLLQLLVYFDAAV